MEPKDKKKRTAAPGKARSNQGRGGTATKSRRPVGNTAAASQRVRKERKVEKKSVSRPRPSADVVYTQPEPFHKGKFLLRLATAAAVVIALFFGMSIFFKAGTVVVSGAKKYTAWQVRQASGIEEGENLLALNEAAISGKIRTQLPYVSKVRVGIKLPDTVNIEITEFDVTYSVESATSGWWLMSAQGRVLESVNSVDAGDHTQILGVRLEDPSVGGQAVAYEPPPPETTAATDASSDTTETLPELVLAAEKLTVAMDIVQYLEDNGILGAAESVNVEDLGQIEVWYGDQYQISLGDSSRLSYKIQMLKKAVDQLGDHYRGMLDISYTLRPDEVVYTPFP